MTASVQITLRNVRHSGALDASIRERADQLDKCCPHIISVQVVVEIPHKHHRQGNLFNVRLEIKVPGDVIVLTRDLREDVYVALRDVFDTARRKLVDYGRRQRGAFKVHDVSLSGTVVRLFREEGYGFIKTAAGDEFYFCADNLATRAFDRLGEGDEVHFICDASGDAPQAKRVSVSRKREPDRFSSHSVGNR